MFIWGLRLLVAGIMWGGSVYANNPEPGLWHAALTRAGGLPVYFTMQLLPAGKAQWQIAIINGADTFRTNNIQVQGDSLFFETPVFESRFRVRLLSSRHMQGSWFKGTAAGEMEWRFGAVQGNFPRIPGSEKPPQASVSGRWQMFFVRRDGSIRKSVGEFVQKDGRVTGTILNPSGDYRFLEGAVRGDSLYITTFDGGRAYAIAARLQGDTAMVNGLFFSGSVPGEAFTAVKNDAARLDLPQPLSRTLPAQPFGFSFPDLEGKVVSLKDERFRGKVVILQLMGSWCPNCLDETRYLSSLYNSRRWPQVEMAALAYELTTDANRSAASLRKFQERLQVQYPMLISGVTSSDPQKGPKTLPALGEIRYFPTLVFIDKKGMLRAIHEGFYGPGAPDYFEAFQRELEEMVEQLLKEN